MPCIFIALYISVFMERKSDSMNIISRRSICGRI
ncbi:hypothetical protein LINPERPRIM_LOCUS37078 [Linum perenne]